MSGSPARAAERVLIIGGGLVGCALAVTLVRRGFAVTVLERRPDDRAAPRGPRSSLSLSLCTRGLRSLERIGVMPRVAPLLAPAAARAIHAEDGAVRVQPYSVFGDAIHCVDRRALGHVLLDAAEAAGVEIRFDARCCGIDPVAGEVTMVDARGIERRERARAIFAADGASSFVRRALHGSWWQASEEVSDEGYLEFRMSAAAAAGIGLRTGVLHGWPRGPLIIGAFPEPGGSFAGTLHLPHEGPISFASLPDAEAISALVARTCGDLAAALPDFASQLAGQRPNNVTAVSCRPWRAGRVLLVGDAAHAMPPYYGQGANAGFQDCELLDQLIGQLTGQLIGPSIGSLGGQSVGQLVGQPMERPMERPPRPRGMDWRRVFARFERMRRPDMAAMAALCREHLEVLRTQVSTPRYHARWALEQALHQLAPDLFTPLYSMIAFSSMSYAAARRRDRLQQRLVGELLRDPDIERRLREPAMRVRLRERLRARLSAAGPPMPSPRPPSHVMDGEEAPTG